MAARPNPLRDDILKLHDEGHSFNKIAFELGTTRNVVAGIVDRHASVRRGNKIYSEETRRDVAKMHDAGLDYKHIANRMCMPRSSVWAILKQHGMAPD